MNAQPCRDCRKPTTRRTELTDEPQCRSCAGFTKGTYQRVKPLPAGKPLAPYHPPALLASKFRDIPGQGMLSLDEDAPERIDYQDGGR